ncbi:flagellar biosynthesis protein FlhB [Bacillus sp. DTU_2020_1000418_1_SI_GHA_SEK_038]|uniref:flagellar biosynthesis protein FlhB n=1 Tax=Bacillus sp. DTU_2020_1000418_1_SI_GHA_SEK_038 TaxID=3077585 RepID=UPI0028E967EA|nr:flagellar biosynthesis protein FlhB [Bacillus sp. DTU_2020_1000418_1_SI_GHA_SEK_038]WNS77190.1 flagellar biosynthesis protein FlhB [Bacillus sp. DTU_2020_1000418_1_SI_GHA_SEK_038]
MKRLIALDLQYFAGEKTEKATPKKRQDSRKKGQVAKSQDVNTAVVLLGVFLFLLFAGSYLKDIVFYIMTHTFNQLMLMELTEANIQIVFLAILKELVLFLGPIMLVAMLSGIVSNYAQVGFLFSTEAIQPKLEKLDPIKGFKRIFSVRAIVELLKSILKIGFVGIITFLVLWSRIDEILILSQKTVGAALATIGSLTVQMGLYASGALLFLSILDFLYQKYDFEKNIRMSKQDIKDEYKNIEGDPLIKSKIKQKQREMAMRRMMQEVPNADVVITNPTHFAVALKYDEAKLDAPYVVAKGVDFVAQKIKMIAKEKDIITVENRPLARALYSQAEIGDAIPEEFFKAVAEILAHVYRMKKKI